MDRHDSCFYDSIGIRKVKTDSFLNGYEYDVNDLKAIRTDSIKVLKFRRKDDPDNLDKECISLNNEFIILNGDMLINIEGVFFRLTKYKP